LIRAFIFTILFSGIVFKKIYSGQLKSNLINSPTTSIETFKQLEEQIDDIIPYTNRWWQTKPLLVNSNDTTIRKISLYLREYVYIKEIIPKYLKDFIKGKAVLIAYDESLNYIIRKYPQIPFKLNIDQRHEVFLFRFMINRNSIRFNAIWRMLVILNKYFKFRKFLFYLILIFLYYIQI
jgi:hypothetical protein